MTNHNDEAALKFLDRALEQDPDHVGVLEAKAIIHLQKGDGDTGQSPSWGCCAASAAVLCTPGPVLPRLIAPPTQPPTTHSAGALGALCGAEP